MTYEQYKKEIVPKLIEKFGYKNKMAAPRITKITINVGVGKNHKDAKYIEMVENSLLRIVGQKTVRAKAKKSIAAFKVREGSPVGVMVTLRGKRMYDFITRLINIAFPRVRDFRGVSEKTVDNTGNINIGIKEHIVFPEISLEDVENIHSMQAAFTTTAKTREEGFELIRLMGFPFKKS